MTNEITVGMTGAEVRASINANINYPVLPLTIDSATGITNKGEETWMHDYPGTGVGGSVDAFYDGRNLFIGKSAGNFTLYKSEAFTGQGQNTGIGDNALHALTVGNLNTAVGCNAGSSMTEGRNCVYVGRAAGWRNTTGIDNVGLGESALERNITGQQNVAVGCNAQMHMYGSSNVAIGENAMFGAWDGAAEGTSTGGQNTAIGGGVLGKIVTGSNNTGVGFSCFRDLTTGGNNVVIGYYSAILNNGFANVVVGADAFNSNLTGNYNVMLGYQAGYYETGSNRLFIDNIARASEADGRAKALIYGIFDAATANQLLTINGNINALEGYKIAGVAGVSGTITSANTVTVVKGIITAIA